MPPLPASPPLSIRVVVGSELGADQPVDAAVIEKAVKFSLAGIASADIVVTGGGDSKDAARSPSRSIMS